MKPIETRDYQVRLIEKVLQAFRNGDKHILLESPTGSGKTIVSLRILKKMEEDNPTLTFGWVAMRRKLLLQAEKENERVGVKNIRFVSMFDKNPPKSKVLMIDEGHHSAAATCADLYKLMEVQMSLSATATPFRTDRIKLSFDKIVNDCGVRFLIEKGYLSQFRQWVIPKWTPEEVTKHYLLDPIKWGKSIVYMKTLPLCDQTVELLRAGGVTAEVVHGGQSRETQDRIYSDFEEGRVRVLVNVYMLTEGFDSSDLQTVFVRDSGKLPTYQMVGRVLRKDPNNPKKVANVVQSEQTWYPYTKVTTAAESYIWQDETWRSISANELVEIISRIVKERILTMPVSLPSYLDDSRGSVVRVSVKGKVSVVKKKRAKRTRLSEILGLGIFDSLPEDLDDGDSGAAAG